MKLYTYDPAPNPARLKMFMAYKGIDIETQQIDLTKVEQQSPEFMAINPEATIPALVLDDGTVLTAVIAMAEYLETQYPERPLFGTNAEQKARVLNWNQRLFNGVFMAVAEAFRNSHPAFENRALPGPLPLPQIPELAERGKIRLEAEFKRLNEQLAEREFIAGDFFSFADIDLLACLDFAGWAARVQPDAELTHLHAWRARAKNALAAE